MKIEHIWVQRKNSLWFGITKCWVPTFLVLRNYKKLLNFTHDSQHFAARAQSQSFYSCSITHPWDTHIFSQAVPLMEHVLQLRDQLSNIIKKITETIIPQATSSRGDACSSKRPLARSNAFFSRKISLKEIGKLMSNSAKYDTSAYFQRLLVGTGLNINI